MAEGGGMSSTVRWVLVSGLGLLTAAVVYAFTTDVIWSIVGLLVAFSIGRAVARPDRPADERTREARRDRTT
jgi:hypothetical protein